MSRDPADPTDPKAKPPLASLRTRPLERNLALTRLGVGAGAKMAAHSVGNLFRSRANREEADRSFYRQQAQVLADELGQLKGSVMKAGQMLSLYGQYFLPKEAVDVLSTLQDDTTAVRWALIEPVLKRNLGARLAELEIAPEVMAAASLGQVYRARRRSDGLELCVKVQYPGVADAIDSDVRTLSGLLSLSRLVPKGLDLTPVFGELRDMLQLEVDYLSEARYTRQFGERLAGDERYVVPAVLSQYSGPQVLTTSFEPGVSVRHPAVQGLSQTRRNALGVAFFDLFLSEFFGWGFVQTDPHFGNYRVRIGADNEGEDRLVLLDFGATRRYPPAFIDAYADIVLGAIDRNRPQLLAGAYGIGLMQKDFPASVVDAFAAMCERFVEPFSDPRAADVEARHFDARGRYCFADSDLPQRAGQIIARNSLSLYFRVPPREIVFLHRRLLGVLVTLSTLRCELALGERLRRVLRARRRSD